MCLSRTAWTRQRPSAVSHGELLPEFQKAARLALEELDAIPLLMAGYCLHYAVVHGLLYLVDAPAERPRILKRMADETAMCRQAMRRR